jgi:hypothetical protein
MVSHLQPGVNDDCSAVSGVIATSVIQSVFSIKSNKERIMTYTLIQLTKMVLLATVVSIAILVLLYVIRNPQLVFGLATVSWNR